MRYALILLVLVGCARIETQTQPTNNLPDFPNRGGTTPVPTEVRVEMRVVGNANSARVRMSNPFDGLVQTVTTLPFVTSFETSEQTMFLSLEVTPLSYSALVQFPFLSAQIFVDGKLFREATSSEFFLNTLSVNGTWRR